MRKVFLEHVGLVGNRYGGKYRIESTVPRHPKEFLLVLAFFIFNNMSIAINMR